VQELGTIAFAATPGGIWDLMLSCPFDVEGAVLRTTPVEGGVAARTLEEGAALAGVWQNRLNYTGLNTQVLSQGL
jgi:hypothetical protein